MQKWNKEVFRIVYLKIGNIVVELNELESTASDHASARTINIKRMDDEFWKRLRDKESIFIISPDPSGYGKVIQIHVTSVLVKCK